MKFPTELDAVDFATEELQAKILPASRKLKEVEKERFERRKIRKRTKNVTTSKAATSSTVEATTTAPGPDGDVAMADAGPSSAEQDKGKATVEGELEDESVYRGREEKELAGLADPDLKKDIGASQTGLYDLVGEFAYLAHINVCMLK